MPSGIAKADTLKSAFRRLSVHDHPAAEAVQDLFLPKGALKYAIFDISEAMP
jgi:hypothetical protein